jgi:methylmalonyl-CoA/ethylmalonyl-CoA epimerase
MLERINHIAIAVPDLAAASAEWRDRLGATLSPPLAQPEHGVTVIFIEFGNTKIELLEPLGADSPIARFLEKNPDGRIHHICFEVEDILTVRDHLVSEGARILGDGNPKIGAHGKPVLFIHPKDITGTLIELEQI